MKGWISYFACVTIIMVACNNEPKQNKTTTTDSAAIVQPASGVNKDSLLAAQGKEILALLKSKEYDSLVKFFLPGDSIHFSPYGFIGSGGQNLTAADWADLLKSNKKLVWGNYDGSGDPINLTVKQYIEKFIYNADFLNAEKTAIDNFIGAGNSLNNLKKVYQNHRFIEYHFGGFDEKYGGMDWTSLRLVFKESGNKYYLVAFVHDQWTI